MLLDARQLPDGEVLEADICIVGGGVAGITLALELAGTSLKVILLESGGMSYDDRTQSLAEGPLLGFQYDDLVDARLRMLGGSSNHWAGNCMRFTPIDFEARDEIPHSGWPITYDDLAPYYERAQPYFELQTERPYDFDHWAERVGMEPLPFDPDIFTNVAINNSPPTAFGHTYEQALIDAPNVTTYLYANAQEIETDDTATTVQAVRVACIDGPQFRVRAKRFALCMGGIEIPRILLLSNAVATAGLGNGKGLVGRFFGDHAALRPSLWFLARARKNDLRLYAQPHYFEVGGFLACITGSESLLRRERLPGFRFHLYEGQTSPGAAAVNQIYGSLSRGKAPPYLSSQIAALAMDLDGVTNRLFRWATGDDDRLIDHPWYAPWISIDCVPNPDSTVHLVEERDLFGQRRIGLDWRLAEQDMLTFKRATELLIREIGRLGLGHAWTEVLRDDYDWPDYVARGKHHCGTTRMSADPATGVVDAQGRVHGMSNLYISSSSVFPTMSYATPTLTIGAMSIRMADFFREDAARGAL